jgi:hypothetical protein
VSYDSICRTLHRCLPAIAASLAVFPAIAQQGAITVPRNLDQLTDRATDIVRGKVVSARVEKHPEFTNLDTVVVTLRVRETLKGDVSGTYTFRQYIWDIRDRRNAAGYAKGQEMLLMMLATNEHGLTSPSGMDQGRFRIQRDRSGREMAVNGAGNYRLFQGLQAEVAKEGVALSPAQASLVAKHRAGPIEVRELTAMIRELARSE